MSHLHQRCRQPEVMDQPDLDPQAHTSALVALERINWWSNSAGILWHSLRTLARSQGSRPLRVLDVATGAGDVPVRLWHRARRAGVNMDIDGCDVSPVALGYARAGAQAAGAEVRFFEIDVLANDLPAGYDAVVSSLFLHHLDEAQAVVVLERMGRAAGRQVLISDLVRGRLGFALAWLATRVLARSWVARIDGPRSVEGAFTPEEAKHLAEQAGLRGATVSRRWPQRFLLNWSRPS